MTPITAQRLNANEHGLRHEEVDSNALDVVEQLRAHGYEAYLVGGCVRDLLLGLDPKDFDVATNATPEEVKDLFRRARLIGRRFRIVHVRYGRHIIEVSTFRKAHVADEDEDERHHADSGLILRDNVWGTLEDDATRRDFTINALYYDPLREEILDFVGGLDDLEHRRLRFIGDTRVRLREDPVRILRAVRFHAKLGFELDPGIVAAIPECAEHLAAIPPARLFDEVCKLFTCGRSAEIWSYMAPTPLRHALFPCAPPDDPLALRAMSNTDARIAADKPVTPGFILAVLLWRDFQARTAALGEHHRPAEARAIAAADTLAEEQEIITIPRRFSQFVREVWALQGRLEHIRPKTAAALLEQPRFRAAYDFLVLRGETGEPVAEAADWWTAFQEQDQAGREDMIRTLGKAPAAPAKRKRRRRRRAGAPAGTAVGAATGNAEDQG
ncbi:MAG: polynucleotide adenylyltransferase PcnB [Pseudomonadales bacterium]|nr:polynucleotide adenylyltransferase PcnB [Pseudomonadales bacterium]